MAITKYIQRLKYIDTLIRYKRTGTLVQLSKKLELSKRATEEYIKEMKEMGFPIKYSRCRQSYYYTQDGKMVDSLFINLDTKS